MIPLGTVAKITPAVGPSLISLYNLYPSATIIGLPATGYSSGQSMNLMEQIAAKTLPPGTGFEWTAMSYQEKVVGGQIYWAFGLALLLVYLVLAGQYESWYAPISVILAVPLSLLGPMIVLTGLRIENNLYTQIGIILLIALSAKNAILIVEVALELHVRDRKPLLESAVEAARARFRPILMTSFAFIFGMLPLVLATGAGANARNPAVRELAERTQGPQARPAADNAIAEREIVVCLPSPRLRREKQRHTQLAAVLAGRSDGTIVPFRCCSRSRATGCDAVDVASPRILPKRLPVRRIIRKSGYP